jgi:hypothetical protein
MWSNPRDKFYRDCSNVSTPFPEDIYNVSFSSIVSYSSADKKEVPLALFTQPPLTHIAFYDLDTVSTLESKSVYTDARYICITVSKQL